VSPTPLAAFQQKNLLPSLRSEDVVQESQLAKFLSRPTGQDQQIIIQNVFTRSSVEHLKDVKPMIRM
jgi:hypothetical protein